MTIGLTLLPAPIGHRFDLRNITTVKVNIKTHVMPLKKKPILPMHRCLPWALVVSRILMAPVAIWMAVARLPAWMWLMQFAIAALSDWFDGKLARRWGTSTAGLRQADSIADTIYVISVAISLWISHPEIVRMHAWGIGLVIGLELLRYPLDWWRFGRGASYHALSAKIFGVSLLIAVTSIMVSDSAGHWLWLSLLIGVISEVEGILISLVLPQWTHDVRSLRRAFELRAQRQRTLM